MIRNVNATDAQAIAHIYNHYVLNTNISFETQAVTTADMLHRITSISAQYPYLVYEHEGHVVGYCYAHLWKERVAYSQTLETTIYLHPDYCHRGIGKRLMQQLIEQCRAQGFHALIACITGGNEGSIALHRALGFEQRACFKEVGRKFGAWLDVVDLELILQG